MMLAELVLFNSLFYKLPKSLIQLLSRQYLITYDYGSLIYE